MSDEVLAIIRVSVVRRWLAVGMQSTLGVLLIYTALRHPPELQWQLFLLILGAGALWLAANTFSATQTYIELTRQGLHDTSGELIVALDEIKKVERGTFAMKPSSGFTLHLNEKAKTRWRPGLWWRMSRRLGIGGATPGSDTKSMAQIIEALLAERT